MTQRRTTVLASALLVAVSAFAHGALAQSNDRLKKFAQQPAAKSAPKAQAPQIPWLVNCAAVKGKSACQAIQRLTIRKTGQLLISVSVRIPPKSKNAAMMLQLPHGLFIPEGVSLKIDDQAAKKHPIQTCDARGCYVGLPIDSRMLKSLRGGKTFSIGFKNLTKKDILIPLSLGGFEEAYKKLL